MTRLNVTIMLVAIAMGGCDASGDVELGAGFECRGRLDDETGYLKPICEHIAARFDSYPDDPNTLEIVEVVSGDEQDRFHAPELSTEEYVFVGLSCCFTGDWAVVAVGTREVVDFYLGNV